MLDRLSAHQEHLAAVVARKVASEAHHRALLAEKLRVRDQQVAQRLAAAEAEQHDSLVFARAREEKWYGKHSHSTKVATFRQIVSRERSRFRFDEAVRRHATEQALQQRHAELARKRTNGISELLKK
jgi:hypothetical protein